MKKSITLLCAAGLLIGPAFAGDFWSKQRAGTNGFNQIESVEHLSAAKAFGAGFVRLAIDKWHTGARDFLGGDFDRYTGLVPEDVSHLRLILDGAAAEHVPVLLTALGVPGGRWVQHNGNEQDTRIWSDTRWHDAAAQYWRDIARTFKGHPAIVGYNVLNEPVPEWNAGISDGNDSAENRDAWCAKVKGTPRDLNVLYRKIVAAIRTQDKKVPIILDAGLWSKPMAARCLEPIDDPHVVYDFHMYEPFEYTTAPAIGGPIRYGYPGRAPYGGVMRDWDGAALAAFLKPLIDWADTHGVARNRLLLGEFGCWRRLPGCAAYLNDIIAAANAAHIHWAFYSWREDAWDAMDYELGSGPTPPGFYDTARKTDIDRSPNTMTEALQTGLKAVNGN